MKNKISTPLLRWYNARKRSLPWRDRPEPYAVWVAEIMAQQTRLESMLPYFERWMRKFPTLAALARASQQDVLAAWEGLGYYSRARNLHEGAHFVMAELGGRIPKDVAGLRQLPGVGPYTAGAIASLAFGADEPAVDGNVLRVLARLFDVEEPIDSNAGRQRIWALAAEHLPPGRAAAYNQALMDLGATVCTPRQPKCAHCPLAAVCLARRRGVQNQRPVKRSASAIPLREYASAVLRRRGQVLVVQRPASGLLAGMWEFPNVQLRGERPKAQLRRALRRSFQLDADLQERLEIYEHTYSHFRARLHVYAGVVNGSRLVSEQPHKWLRPQALRRLPMGRLDRRVADSLQGST